MKIYNEDKTREITIEECDLNRGQLIEDFETIFHEAIETVVEQGHYKVVREYPNGGKDVEWVVDVEGVEGHAAYTETIAFQRYIPYSEEYLLRKEYVEAVDILKKKLTDTDFQAIKYAEGLYTEDQYKPIREQRQEWRNEINRYNIKIQALDKAI